MAMSTKTIGLSLVALLALAGAQAGVAQAAKKKAAPAPKASGPAPNASAEELEKLKGLYKWGMTPQEVMEKVVEKVRGSYDERLKKTAADPTKYDRVQKEMMSEIDKLRKNAVVTFNGTRSG